MKTTNNKDHDVLAEVKKSNNYPMLAKDADMRIYFGIEVYSRRKELGWSQQALAKKINSTQKVISNIENGDVDIQSSTINRLNYVLQFSAESWSRIFGFALPSAFWGNVVSSNSASAFSPVGLKKEPIYIKS